MTRRNAACVIALLVLPSVSTAQRPLAERLRAAGTRTVAFTARARANVCGDGLTSLNDGLSSPMTRFYTSYGSESFSSMSYGSISYTSSSYGGATLLTHEPWDTRIAPCEPGAVRVTVRMVDGQPSWIRTAAGPVATLGDSVMDLGSVSTTDAGAYLQGLARNGDGRASSDAILPIVLIDSLPRWDLLAAAARDTTRLLRYRRRASDFLARAAATTLPPEPNIDEDTRSIRREAVYALVRQEEKNVSPVPQLLKIARENKHRDSRMAALYQLGQTSDPRAIDLFAEMLRGR